MIINLDEMAVKMIVFDTGKSLSEWYELVWDSDVWIWIRI